METYIYHDSKKIKKAISRCIADDLDVQLSSFEIENFDLYSDDLVIIIKISRTPKTLPKDFMLRLVSLASKAVRDTGESRHTIIRPRLSRGQKVAA